MTVFGKQRKSRAKFQPLIVEHRVELRRSGMSWQDTHVDVTEKVVDLFRRILELSSEEERAKVKANAREHFGIEFG